jgi:hypothetical protein
MENNPANRTRENSNQQPPMSNNNTPPTATPLHDDTRTLGIVSIIFAFLCPIIGLIFAIIGRIKVKKIKSMGSSAQGERTLLAGFILSIVMLGTAILLLILTLFITMTFLSAGLDLFLISGADNRNSNSSISGIWRCAPDNSSDIFIYEFNINGDIYSYRAQSPQDDYSRGTYTIKFIDIKSNQVAAEYDVNVTFTESSADGVIDHESADKTVQWNAVLNSANKSKGMMLTIDDDPPYTCSFNSEI